MVININVYEIWLLVYKMTHRVLSLMKQQMVDIWTESVGCEQLIIVLIIMFQQW